MLRVQYLILLPVCLFLLCSCDTDVCPYQICSCAGSQIICEDLGLNAMPPLAGSNSGFSSLLLDGNNISTIPAGSLPSGLATITLSYNPITSIDDSAFDGSATTLNSLTLSRVSFSRIPDAFRRLQVLKYLNIYNANISDWNEDAMKKLGQTVVILNLENVGLTNWPDWIQYFPNLNELTLDVSTISSIPDHALDVLVNSLTSLSISKGSLTSVPLTFSKLGSLKSLALSSNHISNLTWLPLSSVMSTLSLNSNSLTDADHLSSSLRKYGTSLGSIELVDNKLKAIPDFSFLTQVVSIGLSHNQIYDAHAGAMPPGLYEFDLSYNLLPSIPSIWSHLPSVSSLVLNHNSILQISGTDFHPATLEADLSYNLITELTNTSFPSNFHILSILLNNNPISKISSGAFDNLQALTTLNLANTKLTRMPLALASLSNLYDLDMSNCFQLICTCLEKSVGGRIVSLSQVVGQCGVLDIFEFFKTLGPACPT